jgi:hypothetical protein
VTAGLWGLGAAFACSVGFVRAVVRTDVRSPDYETSDLRDAPFAWLLASVLLAVGSLLWLVAVLARRWIG